MGYQAVNVTPGPELKIFDNLKDWLRPEEVSQTLGISKKTVYDWKYRSVRDKNIPSDLFIKFNGYLFVRTEILKHWILSQNS